MKTSSSSRGKIQKDRERSATQVANVKSSRPSTIKPTMPLENTNLNLLGRKTEGKKQLPPKAPSKVQFNVECNMTESKIFQAKQGLLLLKRKMNRTGMSRQKNHSHTDKIDENVKPFTKNNSKQELNAEKAKMQNRSITVSNNQKSLSIPIDRQPAKNTRQRPIQLANQQQDDRPIAHNTNFMDLLEKEMRKEENIKRNQSKKVHQVSKNKIFDENGVEIILNQCSKGCGRMFNSQTIGKHENVCQKVFQSKRKAFNSASHRQVQAQGFQPSINPPKNDSKPQKRKNGIPKWKLESLAFRAGIKLGKNQSLTKQEEKVMQMNQQSLKMCQFCGRKFNDEAAKKHIPFCQKKSKQISKNTFVKRK